MKGGAKPGRESFGSDGGPQAERPERDGAHLQVLALPCRALPCLALPLPDRKPLSLFRYHAEVAPLPLLRPTGALLETGQREREGGDGSWAGQGLAGQGVARYRPLNWGEYRLQRFAGDYADKGVEVQISHFLVDGAQS